MAIDGISVRAVVNELKSKLLTGVITKVAQPEKDGLLLTVHKGRDKYLLMISADPSGPMVYLRSEAAASPDQAPNFCMVLRKYIGGGRIKSVMQPGSEVGSLSEGLERIIIFTIEHRDELHDTAVRFLIAELMGKYSNIILTDDNFIIIDSIRHISHMTSSLREVLPGRKYFLPEALKKEDPLSLRDKERFIKVLTEDKKGVDIFRKIYMSFSGISPRVSGELLLKAGVESDKRAEDLSKDEWDALFREFRALMDRVERGELNPQITKELKEKYEAKSRADSIKKSSEDIRSILKRELDKALRKEELLNKAIADNAGRDKLRRFGELLHTYGYGLKGNESYLDVPDYENDDKLLRIPLDPTLSAAENAQRYLERYDKMKRADKYLREQSKECAKNIWHLMSLNNALGLAKTAGDLDEIRKEMREAGYLCREGQRKTRPKKSEKSPPLHFVSSDGIDIYVGRNNYQNEELTFRVSSPDDWWFHAKNIPGSHVIARTGKGELPDKTALEAAALAAYYSQAGHDEDPHTRIEVDYLRRKGLKRVPGAMKGFVIYHSNYSIMIEPRESV